MTTSPRFSTKHISLKCHWKDTVRSKLASVLPLRLCFSTADTETGPGVYETALAYTTALRMADNAQLFKFAAKSIGMKYGIVPSFMAKPWGNVSSCASSAVFRQS